MVGFFSFCLGGEGVCGVEGGGAMGFEEEKDGWQNMQI